MASPAESDLAYHLVRHYFGPIVANVYNATNQYDLASMKMIKSLLPNVTQLEVRKSILILVKHQLIDYSKSVKGFEYLVAQQRTLCFFRISKYIDIINNKFGNLHSLIIKNLTLKALLTNDSLIQAVMKELSSAITNTGNDLQGKETYVKMRPLIEEAIALLTNRSFLRLTNGYLCVNIERLERETRDELIIEYLSTFYDDKKKSSAVCRAIFEYTPVESSDEFTYTSPAPIKDIFVKLKSQPNMSTLFKEESHLSTYLQETLCDRQKNWVIKSGNHPTKGLMFAVNIAAIFEKLVKDTVSSIVKSRFGPLCCRVFRVLMERGPLLIKQLEEIVMLPNRDVREYVYMLIKDGFIRNRQVPKTPDNAASKSVFILSVELEQVVYSSYDLCCRTILNLLVRHEYEVQRHKSLLDRVKIVQEIIVTNDCDNSKTNGNGIAPVSEEWNEYFNNHELSELNQIKKMLRQATLGRTQVDDTLFILKTWLKLKIKSEQNMNKD